MKSEINLENLPILARWAYIGVDSPEEERNMGYFVLTDNQLEFFADNLNGNPNEEVVRRVDSIKLGLFTGRRELLEKRALGVTVFKPVSRDDLYKLRQAIRETGSDYLKAD